MIRRKYPCGGSISMKKRRYGYGDMLPSLGTYSTNNPFTGQTEQHSIQPSIQPTSPYYSTDNLNALSTPETLKPKPNFFGSQQGQGLGMAANAVANFLPQSQSPYKTATENATEQAGIGVASAIGPWWGALAKVGVSASNKVRGDDLGSHKTGFLADQMNPFHQFTSLQEGSSKEKATAFLNPVMASHLAADRRKEAAEGKKRRELNDVRAQSQQTLADYPIYGVGKYGMKFPAGGQLPYPTDDSEANQLASNVAQYEGDTHREGGIPIDIDNDGGAEVEIEDEEVIKDDMVLSNRLTPSKAVREMAKLHGISPKKRETYASLSARIGKKKGDYEKKLESTIPGESNTARIMSERLDKTIDLLFMDQQVRKFGNKAGNKYPDGGKLPKQPPLIASDATRVAPRITPGPNSPRNIALSDTEPQLAKKIGQLQGLFNPPEPISPLTNFNDVYSTEMEKYENANQPVEPYDYDKDSPNTLHLKTGKFNRAKVPKPLIKDLYTTAKNVGISPMDLIAQVGQESTFGSQIGKGLDRRTKQELISAWDVDEEYVPRDYKRFLADKKVPGVRVDKDFHGWTYEIEDSAATEAYLNKHPELFNQYKKTLATQKKKPEDFDYFKAAAERVKKHGLKQYNPGDPNYEKDVLNSKSLLEQDPVLQGYLKELEQEEFKKPFPERGIATSTGDLGYGGFLNQSIMKKRRYPDGGKLPKKPIKAESLAQLQGSQRGYNIITDYKAGRVSQKVLDAHNAVRKKLPDGGPLPPTYQQSKGVMGPNYLPQDPTLSQEKNDQRAIMNMNDALRFKGLSRGPANTMVPSGDYQALYGNISPNQQVGGGMRAYTDVDPRAMPRADSVIAAGRPIFLRSQQGKQALAMAGASGGYAYGGRLRRYDYGDYLAPSGKRKKLAPIADFWINNPLDKSSTRTQYRPKLEEFQGQYEAPPPNSPEARKFNVGDYKGDIAAGVGGIANQLLINRLETNYSPDTVAAPQNFYTDRSGTITRQANEQFTAASRGLNSSSAQDNLALKANLYGKTLSGVNQSMDQEVQRRDMLNNRFAELKSRTDLFNTGIKNQAKYASMEARNQKKGLTQQNINNTIQSYLGNEQIRELKKSDFARNAIIGSMSGEKGVFERWINRQPDSVRRGLGYQTKVEEERAAKKKAAKEEDTEEMGKGGKIYIKPKNRGKFNALKKRTGKSTEELTHSKNPLTRKRAIFAQNAKKWKH